MKFDKSIHKTILFQILKDIYYDTEIAPFLGFKGGTAALMFYGLDRFSTDIDLDLLDDDKRDLVFGRVEQIAQKYGILKSSYQKRFNLFLLLSYEDGAHNIKIEINRRQFGSRYEVKTYFGLSMLVMTKDDMFAHKLMAMYERMNKTSRDIYDVWFFLSQHFPINKSIVEARSAESFESFMPRCINKLKAVDNRHILSGLGEMLTPSQKVWVKINLKKDVIALLSLTFGNL